MAGHISSGENDMLLENRIAVIAGDAYGIGRAAAQLFAGEGARVVWMDEQSATAVTDEIAAQPQVRYFQADLTDSAAIQAVVREIEGVVDRVDVLFNVAGKAVKQAFEQTTEQTWSEMVGRNLNSVFLCSRHFLPLMKKTSGGAIINHASIDGFLGNPSVAAYSAAKGGVIPLTHVMAHDLGKYGIRVNCISTGGIRNAQTASVTADRPRTEVTPLARTGTPEEIAAVALFLASGLASYINGANIVADGGRTGITQGCYEG